MHHGPTALLAALVAITACAQEATIPKLNSEIILGVAVSKMSIRAGEADTITVTATNNFGEAISIRFTNSCQIFAFIRDPRGRIVTPGRGWTCLPVASVLTLAEDESRAFKFVWTGTTEFAGGLQPSALAPGEYFATATLQAGDFVVHAPPVRVTLLE